MAGWRFTFHQIPFDVAETIRTLERVQGEFPAIERVIAFYRRTSGAQERKIGKLGDKDCKEITPSAGVR